MKISNKYITICALQFANCPALAYFQGHPRSSKDIWVYYVFCIRSDNITHVYVFQKVICPVPSCEYYLEKGYLQNNDFLTPIPSGTLNRPCSHILFLNRSIQLTFLESRN